MVLAQKSRQLAPRRPGLAPLYAPDWDIYSSLDARGTRPSQLARDLRLSRNTVHASLQRLETLGLAERVPDSSNPRFKLARLTRLALKCRADETKYAREAEAHLARRLGASSFKALRAALEADWGPPQLFSHRRRKRVSRRRNGG